MPSWCLARSLLAPVVATIASIVASKATMAIAIATIAIATIVVRVGLSISTPLGEMDDSSRVGHIPASSSIESSYGRDGSRGVAMDSYGGGGGDTGEATHGVGVE